MNFSFTDDAKTDLVEIYRFLDRQGKARKRRFCAELRKCLDQITRMPESWPKVRGDVRVRLMKRFGYGIYFRCRDSKIVIGAIIHSKRRSSILRERYS